MAKEPVTVKIMLCGEAWGAREALFEHAFVGASGVELAKMLHLAKLAPAVPFSYPSEFEMIAHWRKLRETHGIELVNVFNLRPPNNDIDTFFTNAKEGLPTLPPLRRGKYLRPELLPHLEALWARVVEAQPNLLIAFGNTACWALLGETGVAALRGTIKLSKRLAIKVLPTYHPAAVLRQWNLRPIVLSDLEKATSEAEHSEIRRVRRWVNIYPTLAEIAEWFASPADFYAVDIENKPLFITMIGFSRAPDDAIVIPFFDETKPGGNFWPTGEEEAEAWRLVQRGLASPVPKVFQNGVYDLSHLFRSGLRPQACFGDTMLLHHALYPEMRKSLGFLGSIYSTEIAWKTMRTQGNNLKRDE